MKYSRLPPYLNFCTKSNPPSVSPIPIIASPLTFLPITEYELPTSDAAFLFFYYISLLSGTSLLPGWYSKKETNTSLRIIRSWMETQQKDNATVNEANTNLRKHMEPLEDTLAELIDPDEDDDEGSASDASDL